MSAPYEKAIEGFTGLVSEWITDDDLRAKLDFEGEKLRFELDKVLLSTTTHPRVDALVKILIALRDIVIPMLRPVGSMALAAFGAYCLSNDIELSDTLQVVLFGAPVGWGVSRHVEKVKKAEKDDPFED